MRYLGYLHDTGEWIPRYTEMSAVVVDMEFLQHECITLLVSHPPHS